MDLIVKRSFPYRGKVYKKNDRLTVNTRDGRALVTIGRAMVAPKVIEPEIVSVPEKQEPKPKRRYKRRDMKAES